MNCEEARMLLDTYIDGELTQEEMLALENHAKACESCGEELKAAQLLKDTLAHMDDDIAVPLQAQAAWRNAVRAEARKKNNRRWLRGVYAAAAALVIMLGAGAVFENGDAPQQTTMMKAENVAATQALIARDGGEQPAAYSADADSGYTVWKKISVSSADEAVQKVEMLAAEYSGVCSLNGADICRIEIPYEYMQDFLKAASRIGEEAYSEIVDQQAETAVVLIQICEE